MNLMQFLFSWCFLCIYNLFEFFKYVDFWTIREIWIVYGLIKRTFKGTESKTTPKK